MLRRTLILESGRWQYRVGRQYVILWTPLGTRMNVPKHELLDLPAEAVDRAIWKRTSDAVVTPGDVRHYIEKILSFDFLQNYGSVQ